VEASHPQYWVWVTRPEYYLDPDGSDRADLEEGKEIWWSCARDTRAGDLIMLYRAGPRKDDRALLHGRTDKFKDFAYLIRAETDAFPSAEMDLVRPVPWTYGCDAQILMRLQHPLPLSRVRPDRILSKSNPLRGNFQHLAFSMEAREWDRLVELASVKNPSMISVLRKAAKGRRKFTPQREREIEDALSKDLSSLKQFGHNLKLYVDPETDKPGRQFKVPGQGVILDLLCETGGFRKRLVIVEIKKNEADPKDVGQVLGQRQAVQAWSGKRAKCIIVAGGERPAFGGVAADSGIDFVDWRQLNL